MRRLIGKNWPNIRLNPGGVFRPQALPGVFGPQALPGVFGPQALPGVFGHQALLAHHSYSQYHTLFTPKSFYSGKPDNSEDPDDDQQGQIPGGWSTDPLSGNVPGSEPRETGLTQQQKIKSIQEFAPEDLSSKKATPAQLAVKASMQKYGESTKSEDPKGKIFAAGHLNEAFETTRLAAKLGITASQEEVYYKTQKRIPDLTVGTGENKRFVDVKTARIHEPDQIKDMFNTETPNTGLDVAFSSSSRKIAPDSLKHLVKLEQDGSEVDPTRTLRVRSNSMKEGLFISPKEMQERIKLRNTTAQTVPAPVPK